MKLLHRVLYQNITGQIIYLWSNVLDCEVRSRWTFFFQIPLLLKYFFYRIRNHPLIIYQPTSSTHHQSNHLLYIDHVDPNTLHAYFTCEKSWQLIWQSVLRIQRGYLKNKWINTKYLIVIWLNLSCWFHKKQQFELSKFLKKSRMT